MEAEGSGRAHRPRTTAGVRRVSVVVLPGGGGPALGAALRRLHHGDGADQQLRLVIASTVVETTPVLVGDPLTGVFWPFAFPAGDADASRIEARRRANRLWWFLWEHGFDAECVIREGSAAAVVLAEAAEHDASTVIVATGDDRRTRRVARDLERRGRRAGLEVRVAVDAPVGRRRTRAQRWS